MTRQYYAQRCRGGHNPLRRIGVIPVGAIFYVQDECWWRDRLCGRPICRDPWIVEAFLNGTVGAGRHNRETGLWEDVFIAGWSDMVVIRSLRTGRHRHIAIRVLILLEDEGLRRDAATYPDLPFEGCRPWLRRSRNGDAARSAGATPPDPAPRPVACYAA